MGNTEKKHKNADVDFIPLRLDGLLRMLGDQYWEQDASFHFTFLSGNSDGSHGLYPKWLLGKTRWELPALNVDSATWQHHRNELLAHRSFQNFLISRLDLDGHTRWYLDSGEPWFNTAGKFAGYRGISRDITETKVAQDKLTQNDNRLRDLLESTGEYAWETDKNGIILYMSSRVEVILGYPIAALVGRKFTDFVPTYDAQRIRALIRAHQHSGNLLFNLEYTALRADAAIIWQRLSGKSIHNEAGNIIGYRGTALDISKSKMTDSRIQHLITRDPLTSLPNRSQLVARLANAIESARSRHSRLALLVLDIDRFKLINDSLGHPIGDELIRVVGARIHACSRMRDTVARVGGDKFAVLIEDIANNEAASMIAQKLLVSIAAPIKTSSRMLSVTASIGIAVYPDDGIAEHALLKNSDTAMYFAKERGRNRLEFFAIHLGERVYEQLLIENGLRKAIGQHQFSLVYQPVVCMEADISVGTETDTGKAIIAKNNGDILLNNKSLPSSPIGASHIISLRGAEALIRWQHPELGTISPSRFIPIAEEIGLIQEIGDWVLKQVITDMLKWKAQGLVLMPISINISPLQLQAGERFIGKLFTALVAADLPASSIILEITETTVMANIEDVISTLKKLESFGIRIAIDDFGTGHSSLGQLHRLPVSTLKIDQSFIESLDSGSSSKAIVRSILDLANNLGLKTIAEGVEKLAQLEILEELGCRNFQGFHFAKPLLATAMASWLTNRESCSHVKTISRFQAPV